MARINLSEAVRSRIADKEVHLIPVIEKEILHYDILTTLEKMGILERLIFHGGTCLRLCYGAQRRSEDLDFAYDGDLDELNLSSFGDKLSSRLSDRYGLTATVKKPVKTAEFAHAQMQRWRMTVDIAPERPDLPSQHLKLELISAKTLTREVRRIARNYDYLLPAGGSTLAVCETCEEILADKMVSLVNTPPTYIRRRDVWDMMFLLVRPLLERETALGMVGCKGETYGCTLSQKEFVEEGVARIKAVASSREFAKEMRRFMPSEAFDELFGSEMKRTFAIEELCGLYRQLLEV